MPWASLHYPSLAIGILQSLAKQHCPDWEVDSLYANLLWADYLYEHTDGEFTPKQYGEIADELFLCEAGDWAFASALHGVEAWRVNEYVDLFGGTPEQFELVRSTQRHAIAFTAELATWISERHYDVVGFTSTFMQNVPSIALARQLRRVGCQAAIVFGGANCDGVQGRTLHKNFPEIDYVVSGEGETAFPAFLQALTRERHSLETVPGLCWRRSGTQVANSSTESFPIEALPFPSYDGYFEQLDASTVGRFFEPQLVVETARGCWWGEKHHCKFCGLNGSSMHFRSKSPNRVLSELEFLTSKHHILDVIVTDNIIDSHYFSSMLPTLREREWDLRVHYEVKANLKREHLQLLQECGVRHIQPGIESLSAKVLGLMDKGVTGAQNVQTLREAEEANLTVSWNYLVGFPGEDAADYTPVLEQIPKLHHLQPPAGTSRIAIERFSPYFEKPWLGFAAKSLKPVYRLIYDLTDEELVDMVYLFDSPPQGVGEDTRFALQEAIDAWRIAYRDGSTLMQKDFGDRIVIEDGRDRSRPLMHVLSDPASLAIYRVLQKPARTPALIKRVSQMGFSENALRECLNRLKHSGLLFQDGEWLVTVATNDAPFRTRSFSGMQN